ncbi:hypothetical protein Tco_1228174 [Tanacetum coccineum]
MDHVSQRTSYDMWCCFQAPASLIMCKVLCTPFPPHFVLGGLSSVMQTEDEVLPAEEKPLPADVSPTADSPGYRWMMIGGSLGDPGINPAPIGGDNGDDEDESSDDDEDEDVDIEGDEEEEHPAPADSKAVALPAIDQAPSAEETKPFETDESAATPPPQPAYRVTARISIRDEPPTPFWSDTDVARLLAIPTPPPSPHSPWSSPLPHIPSPSLPLTLSLLPVLSLPPASPTYLIGYRAAMIRLRAEALSTSHSLPLPPPIILSYTRSDAPSSGTPPLLPIPLSTSSPPLDLLSTDRREDRLEVTLTPWKWLGIALGLRYEVGESLSAPTARPPRGFRVDYGFVATMDREIMRDLERDVGYRITDTWDEMLTEEFTTMVRQDTDEIYTRLDDEQSERQLMAGRLNMLYRDRRAHARTARLIEAEARMSQEAWGQSMDAADHRRQAQFIEALKLLKRLQTQMTEFERQQGPAKGPAQPDALGRLGGVHRSSWSNLAMTMRTKPDVDTLSIDDLYNNLRVFEEEIQGASKTSLSAQNVAFVSQSKSSTNKVKSGFTSAYSTCTPSTSSTNTPEKEALAGFDDEIAMIAIRMKKFYKKIGRRVRVDGKALVGFDKKKLECFNSQHWSLR